MEKMHNILFQETASHPLGRVWKAASHLQMPGIFAERGRLLGCYALVLVTRGRGKFFNPSCYGIGVRGGDLLMIFPDVPHSYHAVEDEGWDEFSIVFEGPIFDLMREQNCLRPEKPIYHGRQVDFWLSRMQYIFQSSEGPDHISCLKRLTALVQLLGELAHGSSWQPGESSVDSAWLQNAYQLLDQYACQPNIDWDQVPRELGLSYQVFRKRFSKLSGLPPARYVAEQTIRRASELLWERDLSIREVGEACGFANEYHFSRRFKQIMGRPPREFRRPQKS